MPHITTIGLDLAKRVFQVYGMDPEGQTMLRKKVRRGQVLKFFETSSSNVRMPTWESREEGLLRILEGEAAGVATFGHAFLVIHFAVGELFE